MIVVLSEDQPGEPVSVNSQEIHGITEIARLLGYRVYYIPRDSDPTPIQDAFAYAPNFDPAVLGIWVGYIPSVERYAAVYSAALAKNVHLLNTLDQHRTAMEFDRFYPLLSDLTPESIIVRSTANVADIGKRLGFPVFVKGAVRSNKDQGRQACLASNEVELSALIQSLLSRPARSRGSVVVRKFVKLRHTQITTSGFPLSREYRVFLHRHDVLALGYYWEEYPDEWGLSPSEEQIVSNLAREVAQRLDVPFLAVDVGQLESGEWIVIEVADGQFAGLSRVSALRLWNKLKDVTG